MTLKNTSICFSGINFTCAKSSKQQNEDSPDHIILHHTCSTSASRNNLIHLDAGLSLLGHFLGLFVQCLGSLCTFYFIYKSFCQYMLNYAEQHSRCESLNERRVGLIA